MFVAHVLVKYFTGAGNLMYYAYWCSRGLLLYQKEDIMLYGIIIGGLVGHLFVLQYREAGGRGGLLREVVCV